METNIVKHVDKGNIELVMLLVSEISITYCVVTKSGKSFNYVNFFALKKEYTYKSTYSWLGESNYDAKGAELIVSLVNKYIK